LAVRLTVAEAGLPFSPGELESAVQARLPVIRGDGAATDVTVAVAPAPDADTIVVTSGRRLEAVAVAGKRPVEAARLVALAVVAVARPAAPEPVVSDAVAGLGNEAALAASAATPSSASSWEIGAATGVSFGLAGARGSFEPTLELAWAPLARHPDWQIAAGLGFARAEVTWNQRPFELDTFPARLGVRHRWRFVTAGAGPVVRFYRTGGLEGGAGSMLGGFASLGGVLPLGSHLRATATLACDVNAEQLVFRAAGAPVLTVGPFIPWLGLGLIWGAS
jgi:hypothetical protein